MTIRNILVLFVNRRTRTTGAELPVELSTRPDRTKIRYYPYRWVCERPFDLLLNLSTLSGVTIYIYPAEPMALCTWHAIDVTNSSDGGAISVST